MLQIHFVQRVLYDRALPTLLLIYLVCMLVLFRPFLHGVDPYGYYSWIHALVINGNLDTYREFLARICLHATHNCFYRANPYGIGTSLFWAPFFLLAHALAPLLGAAQDGYSRPYVALCAFGSSLYALVGLLLTWRAAGRLYPVGVATLATITLWLASPLIFYMFLNGLLSHAVDVFVNALFLFVYARTRGAPSWRLWLGYGLLIGLAMLVRLPNLFLVALPAVDSIARLWGRARDLAHEAGRYGLLALGAVVALLPQIVVWHVTRGRWLITDPYAGATGDTTDFLHPHILDILFSTDRGMLLWAPALFISLCGLPVIARRDRRLAVGLCLFVLCNYYLVASWSAWSGAISFGPRLFLNCLPACIIGLSALINEAQRRVSLKALGVVSAFLVVWTILLMGQYVLQLVPRGGPVSLRDLIQNQFTLVPSHLGHLLRASFLKHLH